MKTPGLTEEDLKEFYSKAVTYGVEILNNIDKMEALQLREYALDILHPELNSLEEIVIKLPDFDYPVEYKNGNELKYWKDKSSTYSITKPIVDYLNILINGHSNEPLKKSEVRRHTITNPVFKSDFIDEINNILKIHFHNQNEGLLELLKSGDTKNEKLIFNGSGKTLLDFFKQLLKGQFLSISRQSDFELWLSNNFEFTYKGLIKTFTPKYASKIISGNERAAKGNRLIDIVEVNGIFNIKQLPIKNREQK
jgi:hypothetical protein